MTVVPDDVAANGLISVVIAVYNRPHLITDAVNSVLHQHGATFEIIIVNDGSTDTTGNVIDEIAAHNHLITAVHRPNGGPAAARNTGVAASNGTWITFLDSDDTMATGRLATQLQTITPINQPAVVIGKQTIEVAPGVQPPRSITEALTEGSSNLYFMTLMTSRACFDSVGGFDESLRIGEDVDFVYQLHHQGTEVVVCDDVWTHRRIHGDNLIYDDAATRRSVFAALRKGIAATRSGTDSHPA
jgi:glycosyltransferase involved in cell wall biosynthesis